MTEAAMSDGGLGSLFEWPQFSIPQGEKERLLRDRLGELTQFHRAACPSYGRILDALHFDTAESLADFPALPVSLFKTEMLSSVPESEAFKTMTSSGTTGAAVSRIVLDRATADLQTKALSAIMARALGPLRRPMLIIDHPQVVRDRRSFSARGAGVLGMMSFGRRHHYALDTDMRLDLDGLRGFLDRYAGQPILAFGFTFMVWKYLYQALRDSGAEVDLSDVTLIHSGGWKKLADEAVGNAEFKAALAEATGMTDIRNFYGMVEQTGSVFLEGDDGFLYPSNFSDVIVRDPLTWQEAEHGSPGVVEVISALPQSYPGHVLLTEDLGVVHGVGEPGSGWAGKRLEILGRVPRSELRGCSDTHAFDAAVA